MRCGAVCTATHVGATTLQGGVVATCVMLRAAALCMCRRRVCGLCHTKQPVQTQVDAVVVSPVLGQEDGGLAPVTALGMLVQLVECVREPGAGKQRATGIALHDAPMLPR